MRKTLFCLALFCLLTISLADDCQNPLLKPLGLDALGTPESGTGLKFCKSLQNGKTCCSAKTVSSIQDNINTIADSLKQAVITRDKTITEARDQLLPTFRASVKSLQDSLSKMPNAGAVTMGSIATSFDQVAQLISDNSAGLKKSFGDFQKSRTSCVVEVVKLQSAAYCLACDPAYASKGVSAEGDITISDKVCKRLGSACYSFITAAVAQSQLLKVKSIVSMFDGLSEILTKLADPKFDPLSLGNFFKPSNSTPQTADATSPVKLPDGCTSAAQCNWLCKSLLTRGGKLDENVLVIGGNLDTSSGMDALGLGGRLLEEEEEVSVVKSKLAKNRKLASGEWDPESDESGVTVTFQDDPAGVKPADDAYGSRIGSGFICMIAVLVAYLF